MDGDIGPDKAFEQFFRRNETTLRKVAGHFYRFGTYSYHALFATLVEHLWNLYRALPEDETIDHESQWVGVVMFRRALNCYRDSLNSRRRLPIDTGVDITALPDIDDANPYIPRLYELLAHLDDDDRDFIYLYLDRIPLRDIARMQRTSYLAANRRLHRIERKLKRLDETLPDETDY